MHMPTNVSSPTAVPAGHPGMAKAGKVVLIISIIVIALPFVMFLCGLASQMIWLEFADTTKTPPFLVEALTWSLFLVPVAAPVGILGVIIGGLLRWFARKG